MTWSWHVLHTIPPTALTHQLSYLMGLYTGGPSHCGLGVARFHDFIYASTGHPPDQTARLLFSCKTKSTHLFNITVQYLSASARTNWGNCSFEVYTNFSCVPYIIFAAFEITSLVGFTAYVKTASITCYSNQPRSMMSWVYFFLLIFLLCLVNAIFFNAVQDCHALNVIGPALCGLSSRRLVLVCPARVRSPPVYHFSLFS